MAGYLENLLGAVSLAVVDVIEAEAQACVGLGGQAAGALVLLGLRPGMSIKRLAERLRLTHAGAVRLADRLEAEGWVQRRAGDDRRVVRLELTGAGQSRLQALRQGRAAKLARVMGEISPSERAVLEPVLERLAAALTTDLVDAYANCRLCDTPLCEARGCPVEAAARAKFGPPAEPLPKER